ncbi:hypothetical protein LJC49_03395 [Ruminococcaceae bacterium OttesenSCG-928-I18]|nr:hypothetical protein [Ruminococcaceae bacterium OttesenSCG-928-I18]
MSVFEAGMLLCFGFAWPVNIYKSYKSRSIEGKSVLFLFVVFAGYVCGILNKLVYNFDPVFWLYVLNLSMVTVDIILYYRNKRLADRSLKAKAP